MPRIRSVHPELCQDEELAALDNPAAERTFVRLWTHLDDEGRAVDHPKLLKAALYPLHDSMPPERVDEDLQVLADNGMIQRYEVAGKRYLCAKAGPWARYQKPRHPSPSKYPAPPEPDATPTADRRNGSAGSGKPPAVVEVGDGERERRNAAAQRAADVIFENIAGACGWAIKELTGDARGKLNAAAKQLRDADADPDLIPKFPAWWRTTYPGVQLTPQCVSGHWPAFLASRNGRGTSAAITNVVRPTWECSVGNPQCKDGRFFGEDGQMHKCGCQSSKASARG